MNAFTVDVEDWFCSHNLQHKINFDQWHLLESRVVPNTHRLLELLNRFNVKATFFMLGWVAEKFPALVRDIASLGHEIGSHGYSHRLLTQMDERSFQLDLRRSIDVIHECSGIYPAGFRAPAFSITDKTVWAWNTLKQSGIRYDTSVYPFSYHPDYGLPGAPLTIYSPIPELLEIPMSCSNKWGFRVPCSGGAYLRIFPYQLFRRMVKNVIHAGRPYIFYIHPWELDKDSPRISLSRSKAFRHYANLESTERKLCRLLGEFEFTSMQNVLDCHAGI